jgi:hypothetical protein
MVSLEIVDNISHETERPPLKNELKPWLKESWVIPPEEDANCLPHGRCHEVCYPSYDPLHPVVCFDESNKQLVAGV